MQGLFYAQCLSISIARSEHILKIIWGGSTGKFYMNKMHALYEELKFSSQKNSVRYVTGYHKCYFTLFSLSLSFGGIPLVYYLIGRQLTISTLNSGLETLNFNYLSEIGMNDYCLDHLYGFCMPLSTNSLRIKQYYDAINNHNQLIETTYHVDWKRSTPLLSLEKKKWPFWS